MAIITDNINQTRLTVTNLDWLSLLVTVKLRQVHHQSSLTMKPSLATMISLLFVTSHKHCVKDPKQYLL